jgi:probable phosphoglycerate mutase
VTKLLVIRHGRAEGNTEHRFIGQSNVPLDELGRAQALALADRLRGTAIDRIVSSDLSRAIDTISPLAEAIEVPIEPDPRLREISNGLWSGLLPDEIAARWPELWTAYRSGEDVLRPDGEQWSTVRQRAIEAVREHSATGGVIVVCTHGGPALNLALWAGGFPPGGNIFKGRLAAVDNTSITTIEVTGTDRPGGVEEVRLVGFNDVGHLTGALPDDGLPFDPVP